MLVVGVGRRSRAADGCRARSLERVDPSAGARESFEQSNLIAPFMSPSSSFADACLAIISSCPPDLEAPRRCGGWVAATVLSPAEKAPMRLLMAAVRFLLFPPRLA